MLQKKIAHNDKALLCHHFLNKKSASLYWIMKDPVTSDTWMLVRMQQKRTCQRWDNHTNTLTLSTHIYSVTRPVSGLLFCLLFILMCPFLLCSFFPKLSFPQQVTRCKKKTNTTGHNTKYNRCYQTRSKQMQTDVWTQP